MSLLVSWGFLGVPANALYPRGLIPNSTVADLPTSIAPAALRAATMGASSVTVLHSAICLGTSAPLRGRQGENFCLQACLAS